MRCFISIDIPEYVLGEINKIQEQLPEFYGKKTELENLHLTLKFLGHIDKEKVKLVKEKLREVEFEKFETEIDLIGVFSEKFVRIIWLHLKGAEELQKEIDEKLKDLFEPEKRFMGHLTIARVKNVRQKPKLLTTSSKIGQGKDKKLFLEKLKEIKFSEIKFNVENFRLKKSMLKSEGPVYEIIEEYTLDQ